MIKKKSILRHKWFYSIELLVDVMVIVITYYYGFKLQRPGLMPRNVMPSLLIIGAISCVVIVVFKIYRCGERNLTEIILNLIIALPIIAFSSVLVDFIIKGIGVWRRTIFYAFIMQIPVLIILKIICYKIHRLIIHPINCLIIGKTIEDASKIMINLVDSNKIYKVRFLMAENDNSIYKIISKIQHVFICSSVNKVIRTNIIENCNVNNIDCSIVPNFDDIVLNSGKFSNANDKLILNMITKLDIESRFIKRTMDISISIIALLILSPLIGIVTLLVKMQDGGKVFYKQIRLTRGNKEFYIYKFRTMIENAEKDTGVVLASMGDERITKLGKFLRASRIDEIPQLYNVLKGEMSLVGPRPERPDLAKGVIDEIPEFKYRTLVKAGLTGLAQTMGRYDTSFKDKLMFDIYYVNNYSLILDLKILFYTLHTITKPSVTSGISENIDSIELLEKRGYKFKTDNNTIMVKYL
jgi:exopolysaccharide biosynthesis polyprenyl glycosylphosphotransferase